MATSTQPYLSIVIAASNAGYGGDFLTRLQRCIDDKLTLGDRLPLELIVVEWNPPANTTPLLDAIDWRPGEFAAARCIITVPKEQHDKYYNPGGFNFLEYMAKNVGIQRATGTFVLCTNADVIFSAQLSARLARKDLSPHGFYRVNRVDLDQNNNPFQINCANGTWPTPDPVNFDLHPGQSTTGVPWSEQMLHYNAAGDFTMMLKEHWLRTRAYPENTGYMVTLDGEMIWIAHQDMPQNVLPEVIYHQYHSHDGADAKPWYMPPGGWSDASPVGTKNASQAWGLSGVQLTETRIMRGTNEVDGNRPG